MAGPTVRDVWRLALPPGTLLAGGEPGLSRTVLWARRMAVHPPAFGSLEEGDMALLSLETLALLDERLTLTRVVEALAARGASAMGVVGAPSLSAIEASNAQGIPLLVLAPTSSPEADLRDIERDIIRLIVEHEAQVDRRRQEIYQLLTHISIRSDGRSDRAVGPKDGGLPALADALLRITGKPVTIQNRQGAVEALSWPVERDPCPQSLIDSLTACVLRRGGDLRERAAGAATALDCEALSDLGWTRLTAAIAIEGNLAGYLSLLSQEEMDDLDELALRQGALACAIEIAKQRAVAAAEDRMRGDFLGALLTADNARAPALARRASELGYAIEGFHSAAVFGAHPPSVNTLALLATEFRSLLFDAGLRMFICPHEGRRSDRLVALCNADSPAPLRQLEAAAARARTHIAERLAGEAQPPKLTIGIGRPAAGLAGLRESLAQAEEALTLANQLFGGDRVLTFTDLGVYSVLFRLQDTHELQEFYDRTLGPLLRYDTSHHTQLANTLDAFFANLGNVSQTAEALFLHRNSLLYRLERIGEITGLDLNSPDDRFSLQLALRMRPLVAPDSRCQ